MISEPVLRLATAREILTLEQAESLRALVREEAAREFEPEPDHEKLRFIAGFSDVFVVIGIGLFLGAASYFLMDHTTPLISWLSLALLSWGLAELFTRRRRMALPSIILLLAFAATALGSAYMLIAKIWGFHPSGAPWTSDARLEHIGFGLAGLVTCGFVGLHYWRFRVPLTIAAGVAFLSGAFFIFLTVLATDFVTRFGGWIIFAIGLVIFWLAMRFDQSDLKRETRRTDIAFWLHLLAAPVIVHSFIQQVFDGVSDVTMTKALGLIALFLVLALIALLIDRRAILVSALVYAGIAFGTLFQKTALTNATVPASLLVLGAFIIGLSVGWQPLRRATLAFLPDLLRRKLPTISQAQTQ
ncbi:MAG: hypothetical protein ACRDBL_00020 [Rhabdaerophilum sp.]